MGHKRKRQSDAENPDETAAEHPSKVQVVEHETTSNATKDKKKEKSQRKQIRSERRAKKGEVARQNALRKRADAAEDQVQADAIAAGTDFVPLDFDQPPRTKPRAEQTSTTDTNGTTGTSSSSVWKKPKRTSPRSQRLAAKKDKAESLVANEYGKEVLDSHPSNNNDTASVPRSNNRFIVFVGNLPYTATTAQLETHFNKISPKIRHPTDKETGKSRGFAFLEFTDYVKMKTALKAYHHSLFEPDRIAAGKDVRIGDKKNKGRMINVELTAGGGGKSNEREQKIRQKNMKLEEQRVRHREKEMKEQKRKEKFKMRKEQSLRDKEANRASSANGVIDGVGKGDVHPSRLGRVKG